MNDLEVHIAMSESTDPQLIAKLEERARARRRHQQEIRRSNAAVPHISKARYHRARGERAWRKEWA